MALVETCTFLPPTCKAKLQDGGILKVTQLFELLESLVTEGERLFSSEQQRHSHSHKGGHIAAPLTEANKDKFLVEYIDSKLKYTVKNINHSETKLLFSLFKRNHKANKSGNKVDSLLRPLETVTLFDLVESVSVNSTQKKDLSGKGAHNRKKLAHESSPFASSGASPLTTPHFTSFSRSLDALLGGGFPRYQLTELCGPPGVGKTQLLLQLAISGTLDPSLGGLGGEVLFIDTEGSVAPERLQQMCIAAVNLLKNLALQEELKSRTNKKFKNDTEEVLSRTEGDVKAATTQASAKSPRSSPILSPQPKGKTTSKKRSRSVSVAESNGISKNTKSKELTGRKNSSSKSKNVSPLPSQKIQETQQSVLLSEKSKSCDKDENGDIEDENEVNQSVFTHSNKVSGTYTQVKDNVNQSENASVHVSPLTQYSQTYTVDYILKSIHYLRITETSTFLALLHILPQIIAEIEERSREGSPNSSKRKRIKLVIIDSIAMPFRVVDGVGTGGGAYHPQQQRYSGIHDAGSGTTMNRDQHTFQSNASKSAILFSLSQKLQSMAHTHGLTFVMSNHVTPRLVFTGSMDPSDGAVQSTRNSMNYTDRSGSTNLGNHNNVNSTNAGSGTRQSVLIPALGEYWTAGIQSRILLSFHHYLIGEECLYDAYKSRTDSNVERCLEDTVLVQHDYEALEGSGKETMMDGHESPVADRSKYIQHRVARLVKSDSMFDRPLVSLECCFAISKKGIRDITTQ